jgi:hypothetical protein
LNIPKTPRPARLRPAATRFIPAFILAAILSPIPLASAGDTDVEAQLTAAGFSKALAKTPQQLGQYRTLPQRKLLPYDKKGNTFYVYADAEHCHCVYEGDEAAYRRFQGTADRPEGSSD